MTTDLIYEDQSVYGLRYTLVEDQLDKSQFNLLASDEAEFSSLGIYVHASIIGASHVITCTGSDFQFHEVFACCEVKTENKRAYYGPLSNISIINEPIVMNFRNKIRYSFEIEIFDWDAGMVEINGIERTIARNKTKADCIGLEYEFPTDDGIVPRTIILASPVNNLTCGFFTVHSYPNEQKMAITKTLIRRI